MRTELLDYSRISDELLIGRTPLPGDYVHLAEQGVRLVINMRFERPPYQPRQSPPPRFLWLPSFDSPLMPIPLRFLESGVRAALSVIQEGGQVYTHCAGGAHRGVAMGAAILIGRGYSPEAAIDLIRAKRASADPEIWYIRSRIDKFGERWKKRSD